MSDKIEQKNVIAALLRPLVACLVLLGVVCYICYIAFRPSPGVGDSGRPSEPIVPSRIVATAPSLTETLFALGLGDKLVGVGRYCNYPPEVREITRVGGHFDPNLEAIVALDPDLIVMLEGEDEQADAMKSLGIAVLKVDHRSISGILDSFGQIGKRCGVEKNAKELRAQIQKRLDAIDQPASNARRRGAMICVSRTIGGGRLESVYIAGRSPFFNRAIELAGGKNVFASSSVDFPVVSIEGILKANPDLIIDLSRKMDDSKDNAATAPASLDDWGQLSEVNAVRRGAVFEIPDDWATIPGPRFINLVERLAKLIQDQADSD
jgi:cobalamin transport system substrate-binding protein